MVVLFVPTAVYLGLWQFDRSEQRTQRNQQLIEQLQAAPTELSGTTDLANLSEWAPLRLSGRFESGTDVLVRRRIQDGFNGFYVLSSFRTDDGRVFLVNRGWLLARGAANEEIVVPQPPAGDMSLEGRWRNAEVITGEIPADLPPGQVLVINPEQIAERYPTVGRANARGYIQASEALSAQPEGLEVVMLPALGQGPHLAYAVQWMIFGAAAILGWFLLAKREIRQQ